MGSCWSCGAEVMLKDGQTRCDNCNEIIYYRCNDCKKEFYIEEKTKMCSVCGYFYCPHCSVCSMTCEKYKWQGEILKILMPEINSIIYPNLMEKVNKTIKYIESIKISYDKKLCERGNPITYAKNRNKNLFVKLRGFKVKNENDRIAFKKRIEEITDIKIGEKLTISKIRDNGSYGQEYRDAFCVLVCLGKLRVIWIKDKKGKDYAMYERIDYGECQNLNLDNLIYRVCLKCNKRYLEDVLFCESCIKKKGELKGKPFPTTKRVSNLDTCTMCRGDFKKKDGGN